MTEGSCDGDDARWRVLCGPSAGSAGVLSQGRHPILLAIAVPEGQIWGPTFGLDVKREEILRFDPHGSRGHWHENGYDKLGARGSHQDFPEDLVDSGAQFAWSLEHLRTHAQELLVEAGHPDAA